MNTWYFLPIIFISIFLYPLVIKRILAKGQIKEAFIIEEDNELFLYQFIDYYKWVWLRFSSSYETHLYKLRRINLTNLTSEYEKKIVLTSAKLMHGNANIIGINNKYFFVSSDNNLFIVDLKTAENITTKNTILEKNPNIKDFNIDDIIYSRILKTIIVYDKTGDSYYLDTDTLILKRLNREIKDDEKLKSFFNLNNLPQAKLQSFIYDQKENDSYYFPHDIEVQYIPKPGTAKTYIYINYKHKKNQKIHYTELNDCFLHPTVLSHDNKEFPYVKGKEPILMVLHTKEFKPKAKELMLSAIVGNSEILWTRNLSELFINVRFGEDNTLNYFEYKNNLILFLMSGTNRYKMSLSTINKEDGTIIHQPVQYINREIKFKD